MQEEQKCSSCFLTELQQLAGKGDSMAKFLNYVNAPYPVPFLSFEKLR